MVHKSSGQMERLGCKIPPAENPSTRKSLLQNPSTEKSLPATCLHRKISPSNKLLDKMPTSKIPLKIEILLMNFKCVKAYFFPHFKMAYYTKIVRNKGAYLRGLLYIHAISIVLLDDNFGLAPFFK